MNLIERIKSLFSRKTAAPVPDAQPAEPPARQKKTCRECGKVFTIDPSWEHIPNYCRECKQRFVREREEKQRAGAPRKIRRTCKECGRVFTFPNTLEHYPNYCSNCRKAHQAKMKEKYQRGKNRGE